MPQRVLFNKHLFAGAIAKTAYLHEVVQYRQPLFDVLTAHKTFFSQRKYKQNVVNLRFIFIKNNGYPACKMHSGWYVCIIFISSAQICEILRQIHL